MKITNSVIINGDLEVFGDLTVFKDLKVHGSIITNEINMKEISLSEAIKVCKKHGIYVLPITSTKYIPDPNSDYWKNKYYDLIGSMKNVIEDNNE